MNVFSSINNMSLETRASFSVMFSGLAWGLFWIPLRYLETKGIEGAWATLLFYGTPIVLALPWILLNLRRVLGAGLLLQAIGITAGLSMVLYANAVLYTEIVRAIVLFYLTPVWSLILARIFLGELITPPRIAAIFLGITGILVMFWSDGNLSMPEKVGDWMGLIAGFIWAVAAVCMRRNGSRHLPEITAVYFVYSALAALIIVFLPIAGDLPVPGVSQVVWVLPWMIPVTAILAVGAALAAFWGAPHLNPGVVGILFMTEISAAAITAAIWAGEPFGLREFSGVLLISLAGLSEYLYYPLLRWLRIHRQQA